MTPRLTLAAASLVLAAASAALVALPGSAGAARSASAGTYADSTGDGNGAADITSVAISNAPGGPEGQVDIRVNVDGLPTGLDGLTFVLLDTDNDSATGNENALGAEYLFVVDDAEKTYGFARWAGAEWDWEIPYSTVQVFSSFRGVSISVNRSELGDTERFNFWARTTSGDPDSGQFDDAPNDGTWNYSLKAGGPEIRGVVVQTVPAFAPKAGKRFTLRPIGLKLPPSGELVSALPLPERYSCRAKLAGRPLLGSGTGSCSWRIPTQARGRAVGVVVTVAYQGASADFRFVYRVT